jgi:hypothetical protein
VADLHENYPASLRLSLEAEPGSRSWFTPDPRRWVPYERRVVRGATHVVVVVDEAKERLIKDYGLEPDKIAVVMNVEDADHFKGIDLDQDILTRYKDSFVISYIGGGGRHRGLDTAIKAMPISRVDLTGETLVGRYRNERATDTGRLQMLKESKIMWRSLVGSHFIRFQVISRQVMSVWCPTTRTPTQMLRSLTNYSNTCS